MSPDEILDPKLAGRRMPLTAYPGGPVIGEAVLTATADGIYLEGHLDSAAAVAAGLTPERHIAFREEGGLGITSTAISTATSGPQCVKKVQKNRSADSQSSFQEDEMTDHEPPVDVARTERARGFDRRRPPTPADPKQRPVDDRTHEDRNRKDTSDGR